MGKCVMCDQVTYKVLFKRAVVPTYICSWECLQKYFKPIGGVHIQKRIIEQESWLD